MRSEEKSDYPLGDRKLAYAQQILAQSQLDLLDATRLVLEMLETTGYDGDLSREDALRHCRKIIQAGALAYANQTRSLPFEAVVEELLRSKQHLRMRTLVEMRQYCNRIGRGDSHWRFCPLRDITVKDCRDAVYKNFTSPSTQRKAMTILRSVFNFGMRRGLCSSNPIDLVDTPRWEECHIPPLSIKQVKILLKLMDKPEHRACAAAVGIMLWAGVRPTEITRIKWKHINFSDRVIELQPNHSKTGGARLVVMHPVLIKWLRRAGVSALYEGRVIPRSWPRRWRSLRLCAGLTDWQADILRHTYASYHLRHFKNLADLQANMGHANADLLRTRYLSLGGITEKAAATFWGEGG